jgi:hypothetical protein
MPVLFSRVSFAEQRRTPLKSAALLCETVMHPASRNPSTRETDGGIRTPRVPLFYGLFYGRAKFCCKTAQFTATLCECWITEIPSVRNAVRHCENERKESLSNYESPALPCHKPSDLTNTCQIDGVFVRFRVRPFAINHIVKPNDFP